MLRLVAVVACFAFVPHIAAAHTLMTTPTPRSPSDGLKTGPCGDVAPTDAPTMFTAGETITLQWLETVDHPGYYRVAFSPPGDADYEDNILLDDIEDIVCAAPPCNYSAQVTLPSEPCEGCSLQLIQFMGNAPPYSPYFSCADVTLMAAPANPDAGPGDPDAAPVDPGANDDAGIGDGPREPVEVNGGCTATGGSAPLGSACVLLLAIGIFCARRSHSL